MTPRRIGWFLSLQDVWLTTTAHIASYSDPVWNAFSEHTDGSMQWIPKKIVSIGENFHSQVCNDKVRTTLYKVRWEGHDKKLREVWTKDFKSSPTEGDEVEDDDVEMTGEVSGKVSRVDEDPFEKEMLLANETNTEEVIVSYVNPKVLDQLEEWMKENHISNDKFSHDVIFQYWSGRLSGHAHVNKTYPDVVRMWRQFHGCSESGVGIEWVFFSTGKQHDTIKKTVDKTLENTLKTSINTKLPTCDDKGVFTDDDDTYRKQSTVVGVW